MTDSEEVLGSSNIINSTRVNDSDFLENSVNITNSAKVNWDVAIFLFFIIVFYNFTLHFLG